MWTMPRRSATLTAAVRSFTFFFAPHAWCEVKRPPITRYGKKDGAE
jgi:hypothetical protein